MSTGTITDLPTQGASRRSAERGMLLIWACFVLLVILGLVGSGALSQQAHDRLARTELESNGQARAVADAGVVDAYAWLRRQQVQPVNTFAPRRVLTAVLPINETDDATIGLVREVELLPSLWGRYEVRPLTPAEPYVDADADGRYDPGETFTDQDGDGKWDAARGTRDVSAERGMPGAGTVWRIESTGLLYRRPRQDLPLGTPPNDLLASSRVASEVRRLTILPPAAAAIAAGAGSQVQIGSRGRVRGGGSGAGLAFPSGSGSPGIASGAEVTGSPATAPVPDYDASLEAVFGVGAAELRAMADISTSDAAHVPSPIPSYSLVVFDGDITFDAARRLEGTGVVVVLGDCTIAAGSNSWFSGLLWVQGDLTVRAPSYLRGVFVAGGAVDVRGTGGDLAEVEHDGDILAELLALMGQYRHSKTVFVPGSDGDLLSLGG
jgi:hypothetical protein